MAARCELAARCAARYQGATPLLQKAARDVLELTPSFFAIAGPAVLFAGISKGGFGSGAAFAAAAILAIVVEPGLALGVMLPLLMLIDLATLRPYWKKWSFPDPDPRDQ